VLFLAYSRLSLEPSNAAGAEKAVIVQKNKAMLKIAEVCLKLQRRRSQARSIVELFTQRKFSRVPLWSQQKHF